MGAFPRSDANATGILARRLVASLTFPGRVCTREGKREREAEMVQTGPGRLLQYSGHALEIAQLRGPCAGSDKPTELLSVHPSIDGHAGDPVAPWMSKRSDISRGETGASLSAKESTRMSLEVMTKTEAPRTVPSWRDACLRAATPTCCLECASRTFGAFHAV